MVQVGEGTGIPSSQINSQLGDGIATLSRDQTVTFTRYVRLVLPLDGFVFWVKASVLTPSAVLNSTALNAAAYDEPQEVKMPANTVTAKGSLHHNVATLQNEDENFSLNRVIFTTTEEIQDLNAVTYNSIYIGEFDLPPEPAWLTENPATRKIRFAFSSQGYFYQASGLWHYQGDAIYPAMDSQIVDDPRGFDANSLVVSNSLPFWLSLSNPSTEPWVPPRQTFPVFPSFAVPGNLVPPYASVHVDPAETIGLAAAPQVGQTSSHYQLARDVVRVTLYGLRNDAAQDFVDAVNRYSVDSGVVGIMNVPIVRDEKRVQVELEVLAMKKTVEFHVSYYQQRINDFAVQTIREAIPTFLV